MSYFALYGYTFQGLFYEPSNWLPFIAYFVVGAVCGYVQLRNSEAVKAEAVTKTSLCETATRS